MKKILLSLILFSLLGGLKAQKIISDTTFTVGINTTSLIRVPGGVKKTFDIGSSDIFYDIVDDSLSGETTIKLAAKVSEDFDPEYDLEPSSIFLETKDGSLIVIGMIEFSKKPHKYYEFKGEKPIVKKQVVDNVIQKPTVASTALPASPVEKEVSELEKKLMNMQPTCEIGRIGSLSVVIDNIVASDEKIYFRVNLVNNTNIRYPIDMITMSIESKNKRKRNAEQEALLVPEILGNGEDVAPRSANTIILGYDLFTFSKDEQLVMYLREQNGGRSSNVKLSQAKLLKLTQRMY
ncbi:DUF4138 domain-containing protein [Xanthovirga aplysinae]|uniref:DUF4138 domain-containing protein n=1 Tax=Xanthovirga aplysinae TaxID=2529853 RepID=UPI0012BD8177|nr:DUF4138 domain-containing protein [Xanthovirga aplysinae]MTI33297.1 DUF4138 domain-containing protein [Xanthovirga aplysinae]